MTAKRKRQVAASNGEPQPTPAPHVEPITPLRATREERHALLERLYVANLRKLVELMEKTDASELPAAIFNSASKLLADQGVSSDTLDQDRSSFSERLSKQVRDIPVFHGEPQDDGIPAAISTPFPSLAMTAEVRAAIAAIPPLKD